MAMKISRGPHGEKSRINHPPSGPQRTTAWAMRHSLSPSSVRTSSSGTVYMTFRVVAIASVVSGLAPALAPGPSALAQRGRDGAQPNKEVKGVLVTTSLRALPSTGGDPPCRSASSPPCVQCTHVHTVRDADVASCCLHHSSRAERAHACRCWSASFETRVGISTCSGRLSHGARDGRRVMREGGWGRTGGRERIILVARASWRKPIDVGAFGAFHGGRVWQQSPLCRSVRGKPVAVNRANPPSRALDGTRHKAQAQTQGLVTCVERHACNTRVSRKNFRTP